jgi:hypothetical protein
MIPSRPAAALMALGVLAGAMGCGRRDAPTEPLPPLSLSIRVVNQFPPEIAVLAEGPIIQCGVDLEATVDGPGRARFEGATFRWYAGVDRGSVLDSLRVPGWQARAAWTADTLSAARVETTSWDISARAPFDAEIRFHYRDVGTNATGTASTRFTCGPTLPAGGTPAPTIAVLEVTTRPELEPGDTVRVTYVAQSSFGLWTTEANTESAFALRRHFAELMGPVALRDALFEVPRGATLGVPLAIVVQAADLALQTTTTRVETTMRVVDRRPPVIVSHGPLSGDFTVGQLFPITVRATDNNQLGWLVYEFGAPVHLVDSVRVAADVPTSDWNVPLLVRPTWVGTPSLTVFVRDAAGNASFPLQSPTGGLRFLAAP